MNMEVLQLPAKGTLIILQSGLGLLGVTLAVKYAIKRFISKKKTK